MKYISNSTLLVSLLSSTGTTEVLQDKNMTGNPIVDLVIKIGVPIVSGIALPLVKEWLETRRQKRAERKRKSRSHIKTPSHQGPASAASAMQEGG